MEEQRGGIGKWLLIALAAILFYQVGWPLLMGKKEGEKQPFAGIDDKVAPAEEKRTPEKLCTIKRDRFTAELSTRGASLRHVFLADKRYESNGKPLDLVSKDLRESRMPLRSDFRPSTLVDPTRGKPSSNLVLAGDTTQQVAFDDFDWTLATEDGTTCGFTYEDATTKLTKTITATGGPFELSVAITVENLADQPKKHRLAVEESAWRTQKEIAGGFLQRQSEFASEVVASATKTERYSPKDFEPNDFKKEAFDDEKWRQDPGPARFAAVSSSYFSQVIAPVEAAKAPRVETQIEEHWDETHFATSSKTKDPQYGFLFRARVTYPEVELAPKQVATYKLVSFAGPKEREVLAAVGSDISGVINLGYFSFIGKGLVWYLYKLETFTHSWGWAIVLLTITVRLLLAPLSLAQIKNGVQMRKLKPELDVINKKHKDDMTQRGVATQEVYRKHGMSPFSFATGCLPMLLQLPVWWALYSALQSAVELYHTPFLWFVDLSAPDKFYIIPIILGASSFLQQKIMPQQGDAQQQKMMMYMMPAVFTVMMLFLPSGLGVYMLSSSIVSIGQQLAVERYYRSKAAAGIVVKEKLSDDDDKSPPILGKGKARVRG